MITLFVFTHELRYGLIRDAALFAWLEGNMDRLLARDTEAIAYAIERSCVNKVGSLVYKGRQSPSCAVKLPHAM